ncbi:hypothetical protein ACOSQ3_013558 [Xanthoceras sorbifolium]
MKSTKRQAITFTKRRSGIYKKASELVTLTGAQVGFVVFSPLRRPYFFGHPSMEFVWNRFLGVNSPSNDSTTLLLRVMAR